MGRSITWRAAVQALIGCGLLFLVLGGCSGSQSSQDCVPTQKPGSCCKTDQDCRPREKCVVQFPQGYCAEPCSQDSPTCSEETTCAHFDFTSSGGHAEGYYCLAKCGAGFVDCREEYYCKRVDADSQVCWPK
jgi:hypothetical protein